MLTLIKSSSMTVKEQLEVIDAATLKICESRETALAFLKSAGILDLIEQSKKHAEPSVSVKRRRKA